MKAVRIHRFGPPEVIVIEDIPKPSPGKGEGLVRVATAGVAPWDAIIQAPFLARRATVRNAKPSGLRRPLLYQRYMVKLSRYRVEDPLVPMPSTWKLATNAPSAHPREKSEFTVWLMGVSTPSNHTE